MPRAPKTNSIPRPPNAFILFRRHLCQNLVLEGALCPPQQEISIIAGERWGAMDSAARAPFFDQAVQVREKHKEEYPDYAFRPVKPNRTPSPRRTRTKAKSRTMSTRHIPAPIPISDSLGSVAAAGRLDVSSSSQTELSHVPCHTSPAVLPSFGPQPTLGAYSENSAPPAQDTTVYGLDPEQYWSEFFKNMDRGLSQDLPAPMMAQSSGLSQPSQDLTPVELAALLPETMSVDQNTGSVPASMQDGSSLWASDLTALSLDFYAQSTELDWPYRDASAQYLAGYSSASHDDFEQLLADNSFL